jgi:hypothetical protein
MSDAQLDAAYFALEAAGYSGMEVRVAETGWASAGDATEAGANMGNAARTTATFGSGCSCARGRPAGPTSERHYDLFKPDGSVSTLHSHQPQGALPSSSAPPPPTPVPFKVGNMFLVLIFNAIHNHK